MSAGEDWDAISSDPEFQAQPITTRNKVALSFFNKRIAPNAPAEQLNAIRNSFFTDAFKAPEREEMPSLGRNIADTATGTFKADIPVVGKAIKAVRAGAAQKGYDIAGKPGAAIGAAVGAAAEMLPATIAEASLAAAAGPAMKYAGKTIAPKIMGFLTGIEQPLIRRAFERAGQLGGGDLLKSETIEKSMAAINEGIKVARRSMGEKLGLAADAVVARNPGKIIPTAPIAFSLEGKLAKAGYDVPGHSVGDTVRKLNPKVSEIIDDLKNVSGAVPGRRELGIESGKFAQIDIPAVQGAPQIMDFRKALNIRKKIDDAVTWRGSQSLGLDKADVALLKEARRKLNAKLLSVDKDFTRANNEFARTATAYDFLEKNILNGQPETVERRLLKIFKKGNIDRKVIENVDKISESAALNMDRILDAMTAQRFKPLLNPRTERAMTQTGGGLLGAAGLSGIVSSPGAAAGGLGIMAATSPKINMAAIRAINAPIGKSKVVEKVAKPAAASLSALAQLRKMRKKEQE